MLSLWASCFSDFKRNVGNDWGDSAHKNSMPQAENKPTVPKPLRLEYQTGLISQCPNRSWPISPRNWSIHASSSTYSTTFQDCRSPEESECGRTASENAHAMLSVWCTDASLGLCPYVLLLTQSLSIRLHSGHPVALSPKEARDFENQKCNHLQGYLPGFYSSLCPILCTGCACETAMTQERISFQLAVCCAKMLRITSRCVAMIDMMGTTSWYLRNRCSTFVSVWSSSLFMFFCCKSPPSGFCRGVTCCVAFCFTFRHFLVFAWLLLAGLVYCHNMS